MILLAAYNYYTDDCSYMSDCNVLLLYFCEITVIVACMIDWLIDIALRVYVIAIVVYMCIIAIAACVHCCMCDC